VGLKQAYDSIDINKLLQKKNYFGIPTKVVKLVSAKMEVNRELRERDKPAPFLFNIALEYAIRQLSVHVNASPVYKSGQIAGCADHINIMGRSM
jgi:hypothetical protein